MIMVTERFSCWNRG